MWFSSTICVGLVSILRSSCCIEPSISVVHTILTARHAPKIGSNNSTVIPVSVIIWHYHWDITNDVIWELFSRKSVTIFPAS